MPFLPRQFRHLSHLGRAGGTKRLGIGLGVLFAAAALLLSASALASPTTGSITGTVTNATGSGIEGVQVRASMLSEGEWDSYGSSDTDSLGKYDVSELPAGMYRLEFRDNDGAYLTEFYDNAAKIDTASDVAVVAGSTTSNINATLAPAGHITGKITNSKGIGIAHAEAEAYALTDGSWQRYASQSANLGTYDIGGLPTGTYRVKLSAIADGRAGEFYNDAATLSSATEVAVTAGSTTPNINATLVPAGHITGKVTSRTGGIALSGIDVTVYDVSSGGVTDSWLNTRTNWLGNYDASGLPTGTYRVKFGNDEDATFIGGYYKNAVAFASGTDVAVTAGSTTPGINMALVYGPNVPKAAISGASVTPVKPTHGKPATFVALLTPVAASNSGNARVEFFRKVTESAKKKVKVGGAWKWKTYSKTYYKAQSIAWMDSSETEGRVSATYTPKKAGAWKMVVTYTGNGYTACSLAKLFVVK